MNNLHSTFKLQVTKNIYFNQKEIPTSDRQENWSCCCLYQLEAQAVFHLIPVTFKQSLRRSWLVFGSSSSIGPHRSVGRERETERECMCMCVCVCVRERERKNWARGPRSKSFSLAPTPRYLTGFKVSSIKNVQQSRSWSDLSSLTFLCFSQASIWNSL